MSSLKGSVFGEGMLSGTLSRSISYTEYEGAYEILPDVMYDQVLETADRLLTDDILVKKVPYHETSNSANGKTVYIG